MLWRRVDWYRFVSLNLYQSTRHNDLENSNLHNHRRENVVVLSTVLHAPRSVRLYSVKTLFPAVTVGQTVIMSRLRRSVHKCSLRERNHWHSVLKSASDIRADTGAWRVVDSCSLVLSAEDITQFEWIVSHADCVS